MGEALNVTPAPPLFACTVTTANPPPLLPEQLRLKLVSLSMLVIDSEPESVLLPDQPSEASHSLALLEFHVSVIEPPGATIDGEADKLTLAGTLWLGIGETADELPLPPLHAQREDTTTKGIRLRR